LTAVTFLVTLFQNEEGIKAVHCSLHDLPHFSLSDREYCGVTVTGEAGLYGIDILYWAIAERQRYEVPWPLGLSLADPREYWWTFSYRRTF
jgi:hypothetical protein